MIGRVSGEGTDCYTKRDDYHLSDAEYRELKDITLVFEADGDRDIDDGEIGAKFKNNEVFIPEALVAA